MPVLMTALGLTPDGDGNARERPISARYDATKEIFYLHFQHSFAAPSITLPVGLNFALDGFGSIKTVDAAGNPTPRR